MRKTYIIATLIAVAIGLWLFSGQIDEGEPVRHGTLAAQNTKSSAAAEDRTPTRVRARTSQAQTYTASVLVRGRTENKRSVDVRAETQGRVESRPVEKGTRVEAGALLCRLAIEDRNASLNEAREGFNQARIDFDGAQRLKAKGFQADSDIARARARLASAQASVERAKLAIARTYIRAPFDGIIEDTQAEIGDYLQPGAPCATVIDLDPMLLVGRISERDVAHLDVGSNATAELGDNTKLEGKVSFIGRQSDESTRTYPLEISIPNPDYRIRSGLTAQVRVPIGEVKAHLISPALLALDTAGNIGVRTLSDTDRVIWNNITIIDDEGSGAWITGLPDVAKIITVGQELVVPGEQVEAVFEQTPAMPASTPATDKTRPGRSDRNSNTTDEALSPAKTPSQLDANAVAAS